MATQTTEEPALVLTPPDPVPTVQPAKAAGLVPVDDTKRTELQRRVDDFIDQFGRVRVLRHQLVDAISNLGAREIREAALTNGAAQIIGVTKYVDADVRPAPVEAADEAAVAVERVCEPLTPIRFAAAFEEAAQ